MSTENITVLWREGLIQAPFKTGMNTVQGFHPSYSRHFPITTFSHVYEVHIRL